MEDVLLNEVLLPLAEAERVHLVLEHVPGVLAFSLVAASLVVLALDVALGQFGALLHSLGDVRGRLLRRVRLLHLVLRSDLGCGGRPCVQLVCVRLNLKVVGHTLQRLI